MGVLREEPLRGVVESIAIVFQSASRDFVFQQLRVLGEEQWVGLSAPAVRVLGADDVTFEAFLRGLHVASVRVCCLRDQSSKKPSDRYRERKRESKEG